MTNARVWLTSIVVVALLAGCGTGSPPAEPEREPVPESEGLSEPCTFLTDAELATAMDWSAEDAEEFGGWVETDLDAGTACSWTNDDFTVTVRVLTGRAANYSAITERTEEVMVVYHMTRATRDAVGLLSSVWIEAGRDYLVQVTQEPALLVDERFGALAYAAALAFENSSLNVG